MNHTFKNKINKGMTVPELVMATLMLTAFTSVFIVVARFTANFLQPDNVDGEKNFEYAKDISIKDLADLVAKKCKYDGKIIWDHSKPDGTPQKLLDVSKLRELGWEHKIKLDLGIEKTIKSYKKELNENTIRI